MDAVVSLIPEKNNLMNYSSRMAGNPHFQQCSIVIKDYSLVYVLTVCGAVFDLKCLSQTMSLIIFQKQSFLTFAVLEELKANSSHIALSCQGNARGNVLYNVPRRSANLGSGTLTRAQNPKIPYQK